MQRPERTKWKIKKLSERGRRERNGRIEEAYGLTIVAEFQSRKLKVREECVSLRYKKKIE